MSQPSQGSESTNAIDALLNQALSLHQSGDLAAAEKYYLKILDQQPDNANAMQLLGTANFQTGNLENAQKLLSEALLIDPTMAQAHCNLGNVLSNLGKIDNAISAYQQSIQLDPQQAPAQTNLGNLYRIKGLVTESEAAHKAALEVLPDFIDAQINLGILYLDQNRLAEAEQRLEKTIQSNPDHPGAHFYLGEVLAKHGQATTAITHYKQSLSLQPNNIPTLDKLGNAYGETGQYHQAADCFKQILTLANLADPAQLISYRYKLGLSQFHLKEYGQAIDCHQKILETHPDYAESHHDLGMIYQRQNKMALAQQHFKRAIELNPDKAMFYCNFAKLTAAQSDIDATLFNYRKAIELAPQMLEAYRGLAEFCHRHKDHGKAIETLLPALEKYPDNIDITFDIGIYYENWGRPDEALPYYEKVLELDPDNQEAQASVAAVRILEGRYDDAYKILSPLITTAQPTFRTISCFADIAHRFDQQPKAIETLLEALKDSKTEDRGIAELHFALGKIYDRGKDYGAAFKHYALGNQLIKPDFNKNLLQQKFDQLISVHSSGKHSHFSRSTCNSKSPIFIVGMERSGTSLIEQILASHPDVHGAGELAAIPDIIYNMPDTSQQLYPQCANSLTTAQLNQFAETYLNISTQHSGNAIRVIDKLPGNFIHLGLIELMFPNAKIIHCKRGPADTCLSCYFQQFGGNLPYTYDQEDLGFYYRQYERLMTHWKSVITLPIYEIQYEDVVSSTEEKVRELIHFVDVDWNESCLNFHKTKRTVATASSDQVRTPMYQSSVARWKNYEQFLEPLLTALQ